MGAVRCAERVYRRSEKEPIPDDFGTRGAFLLAGGTTVPPAVANRGDLCQSGEYHNSNSQYDENNTGRTVKRFRCRFIGKNRCDTSPDKRENHAKHPHKRIRHAADGEVRDCTGQRGERHDKYASADCGFQFVAEHGGQNQQHHHAAAGTDKTADKPDQHTADDGLHGTLVRRYAHHCLFGGHNRTDDEFDAEQEGHKYGKASHCPRGQQAGDVTADHGERKHADHHQQAVFYIQIFVFTVGVGGHSARQYVGRQGNADRHVRVHVQEGDEHGADDGGSTHARKAGAESGTHACEKRNNNREKQGHISVPPAGFRLNCD